LGAVTSKKVIARREGAMPANIIVVDDEEIMRDLIETSLTRLGHRVRACRNGAEALVALSKDPADLMVSDLKMPGMTGLELAEKAMAQDSALAVILMTAYGTVENAVQAMKLGVQDFIEKPFQIEMLEHTVAQVLQMRRLRDENLRLRQALENRHRLVGGEGPISDLLHTIGEVAESNSTVLILGESGTGKELLAHALHLRSRRAAGPFIKINCAAIPDNLLESELFGHEKGAYTGALRTRVGRFELADGGTLLLDEIGEMPLAAQSKLLRVLQERIVTKVGSNEEVPVDVRIVCTTHRDLEDEVRQGRFREDLFYRLNVIPLKVPPLRARKGDLDALAAHFIEKYNAEDGYQVSGLSEAASARLKAHAWPGNVRELENVVHRAVVFAKAGLLEPPHLRMDSISATPALEDDVETLSPGMSVAEAEKQLILKTLEACQQNRTKAAEMLDISIRTLRNKLNEYKLQP
jgi:DNA-binding NtrC family response regulator